MDSCFQKNYKHHGTNLFVQNSISFCTERTNKLERMKIMRSPNQTERTNYTTFKVYGSLNSILILFMEPNILEAFTTRESMCGLKLRNHKWNPHCQTCDLIILCFNKAFATKLHLQTTIKFF
jgi:hypothetical protein